MTRSSRRRRLWIRAAALALGSAALVLLLAEGWLRFFRPVAHRARQSPALVDAGGVPIHRHSPVPGVPYELAPGARGTHSGVEVSVNALGLRGPETAREKPPGILRIAALGDSVTFGWSVRAEEAWPAALERALREDPALLDGREPQVLNCAVSGFNTRDEAALLEGRVLDLDPDLIVVGYFLNDPQTAPLQPLQRWFHQPEWWEHSHLLRLLDSQRMLRDKQRHGGGDGYRYLHAQDGPCWKIVPAAFARMHRDAAARGIPVLVAVFPAFAPFPDWENYRWKDLHAQVVEAATREGLAAIDLYPAFAATGREPRSLAVDSEHPNAEGHEVAARAIAEALRRERERLLPRPAGR